MTFDPREIVSYAGLLRGRRESLGTRLKFDSNLAWKEGEGTTQKGVYNTPEITWHPDATSGLSMKKEHDRYTLAEIMKAVVLPEHTAEELIALVTDLSVNLETVCTHLSQLTF